MRTTTIRASESVLAKGNIAAKMLTILLGFLCFSSPFSYAGDTYFTNSDNEDNAGTQTPDGDLGVFITEPDANHPIEFNIDVTGTLPASEAHLSINAFDIDEELFELNQVFLNGNLLDTLHGESDENTTTVFSVPTNIVQAGNNLVEILVDPDGWTLRVNWGQLLIDGGAETNAIIQDSEITSYSADITTSTLNVNVDLGINTNGNYRVELNLLDQNNNNIGYAFEDFSANSGDQLSRNYPLSYSTASFSGTFRVEVLLFFDNGSIDVHESLDTFEFDHLQTIGPSLPAEAQVSTIDASNFSVIADGTTPTTITVQGIDSTLGNTQYSGQTVMLNTTAGALGPVTDNGNGTYTATLTAASSTSVATITGTIDGLAIVDTATVSFVPGSASRFTSTISSADASIEANGQSSTVITVQTIDAFGNNLVQGGNAVVLNTSSGSLSAISDQGDGTYVATLTSSTEVTTATISGTLNGADFIDNEIVNFTVGPANINNTTINASLPAIYADGSSESIITIQTFDLGGNPLTTGGDNIVLNTNAGTISAVTDNANGTYTATLRSLTIPGTASVSGLLDGSFIADSASVDFVAIPTVTPLNTNTATPTIQGTLELIAGASFSVNVNGVTYNLGDGNLFLSANDWALTIPPGNALTDGTYSVTASVIDGAAHISTDQSSNELFLDLTPPTLSLDSLPDATSLNILSYEISGSCSTLNDLLSITLTDINNDTVTFPNLNCPNGAFSQTVNMAALSDGMITIEVLVSDLGGNEASTSTSINKDGCVPSDIGLLCDDDNDGIPNGIEEILGTDSNDSDSDGDSISDEIEIGSDFNFPSDSDGDGIIDALDEDSDNDGIFDIGEAGNNPDTPRDFDGDGTPDYRDRDSDNDNVPDAVEFNYFNLDPDNDGNLNFIDRDSDDDGIPDALENGISQNQDSDFDGIDDAFDVDNTQGQDSNNDGIDDSVRLLDTDQDGRYNIFDIDSDNDGISGRTESSLLGALDSDGDGISDRFDADNTGGNDYNLDGIDDRATLLDSDGDGVPDYLDLDSDNDSLMDIVEAGGSDVNPVDGLVDNPDADQGQLVAPTDSDGDGIPDYLDLQSDNAFNNGIGSFDIQQNPDSPLIDQNNDGVVDSTTDADQDGVADSTDETKFGFGSNPDFDGDGIPNNEDLDDDNDGIPDALEGNGTIDSDGDGYADSQDLDADNDGITDLFESRFGLEDQNQDGIADNFTDQNNDGLDDNISPNAEAIDSDNDGVPDFRDIDSDGDSISDLQETAEANNINASIMDQDGDGRADTVRNGQVLTFISPIDSDGDGQADYLDTDSDNDGLSDQQEAASADRLESQSDELRTAVGGAGALSWEILLLLALALVSSLRLLHNNIFNQNSNSGFGS